MWERALRAWPDHAVRPRLLPRLLGKAREWLAWAGGCASARAPLKKMREALHAGLRLGCELPQVEALRADIRRREWEEQAKKVGYMAARPVVGEGQDGMVWTLLIEHAANFDPALLNVAFVFLFLGYGTKVGLAPLHAWLPDAHAEGPTPISAVLSGLLLNVALYALLRFKILLAANPAAIAPGPLMVTMGLLSLVFAAFMLYRRRDIKRLFAYSSIEHMGIIVFAFGMGGPLANFAGLLHMVMHSLTKSAIFYAVGHISQIKGTQRISRIRGLTVTHPALGWGLVTGVVAIAGLPPLGIFMSEFLVVSSTFARQPLLAIVLVFGLLLAFGALTLRLTSVAFGEPRGSTKSAEASYVPMFAHLSLVLIAGIYLPAPLVVWFQHVARLLG